MIIGCIVGFIFIVYLTAMFFGRIEFKARDCWIGAYWDVRGHRYKYDKPEDQVFELVEALHIWICLLPMLPIHVIIPLA